jgi:hypothetical protein
MNGLKWGHQRFKFMLSNPDDYVFWGMWAMEDIFDFSGQANFSWSVPTYCSTKEDLYISFHLTPDVTNEYGDLIANSAWRLLPVSSLERPSSGNQCQSRKRFWFIIAFWWIVYWAANTTDISETRVFGALANVSCVVSDKDQFITPPLKVPAFRMSDNSRWHSRRKSLAREIQ